MGIVEIEEIRRLNVHPGETVVARVPEWTTRKEAELIAAQLRERLPRGVQCLVATCELTVVAKPRRLTWRTYRALTEGQRSELQQWLSDRDLKPEDVMEIVVTDDQATVCLYRRDAEGKRYAVDNEHVATESVAFPLHEAPLWFYEMAA